MDIDSALRRYPIQLVLSNGVEVSIRPLKPDDEEQLARFFRRVPEEDRYYLKADVTDRNVVHSWIEDIDYERTIPLVAIAQGEIVADATLHRSRAPARRHVGELRIVVDPDYRGSGLGSRLIQELTIIGKALDLHMLFLEMVERWQLSAIRAALSVGFQETTVLEERIRDPRGNLLHMAVLELRLADVSP